MTTRRRNSDLIEDESRSHKYRKVQPEVSGQAHPSNEHKPRSDEGVSLSETLSDTNLVWKGNPYTTAEVLLRKPPIKTIHHTFPNLDPGLGQLSLRSPEIRGLI